MRRRRQPLKVVAPPSPLPFGEKRKAETKISANRFSFLSGCAHKTPQGSYKIHRITGGKEEQIACGLHPVTTNRWLPDPNLSTKVRTRGVPFVDGGGHFSGSIMTTLKSSASEYFATMVRKTLDVIKRRVGYHQRRNKISLDCLSRIAIFYNIELNDYALERILRCNPKYTRKLVEKYTRNMDDQKRFLYGQMCLHLSWLKHRGSKIPRVKSIKKTYLAEYRSFGLRNYGVSRELTSVLNWLGDPWIVGPLKGQ